MTWIMKAIETEHLLDLDPILSQAHFIHAVACSSCGGIEALEISKFADADVKLYGDNHLKTAAAYDCMGYASFISKDYGSALEFYNKALNLRQRLLGVNHHDTVNAGIRMAYIESKLALSIWE
jgi:hypothetical protein